MYIILFKAQDNSIILILGMRKLKFRKIGITCPRSCS